MNEPVVAPPAPPAAGDRPAAPPAAPATPPLPASLAAEVAKILAGSSSAPAPPQPPPAAPPTTKMVEIAPERFQELLALEQQKKDAEDLVRRKDEEKKIADGKAAEVLAQRDTELAAEKTRVDTEIERGRTFVRDRELAIALAGQPILEGQGQNLMKLWKDDFKAIPDGDTYKVVLAAGGTKTVVEEVADRLKLPLYASFLRPSTQGGANAGRTDMAPPPGTPAQPANAGEAMVLAGKQMLAAQSGPNRSLSQSIGWGGPPSNVASRN